MDAKLIDVPVAGGHLRVATWGDGDPVIVAAHGVTANHKCWAPLAAALGGHATLLAPDLRGRGASASLPGPYGMDAHAADVVALLDHVAAPSAIVVGHSMGGFVAVAIAARHSQRCERLVLVDGGIPLDVPVAEGVPIEKLVQSVIGPALDRLRLTFPTRDAYRSFWRAHPAFSGDAWTPAVEAYVDYDLTGEEPELRSGVSLDAVLRDSEDTLVSADDHLALEDAPCPAVLLRAPLGIMAEPPGLYPEEHMIRIRRRLPSLHDVVVERTNHYTIVLSDAGAASIAEHIVAS
jgi:pimeloyl-ACP methyl ester carboxylesterase